MPIDPKQLKTFLLDAGLISEKNFKKAQEIAKANKQSLSEVLVTSGFVPEESFTRIKAYLLGIPFISLEKEIVPHEVLEIIPEPIARSHNIVAFKKNGQNLEVAMLDPGDLQTIDFIKKESNLKILPRLTTAEGIKNILSQYRKTLKAEFKEFIKKEAKGIQTIPFSSSQKTKTPKNLKEIAEKVPVIRIVDTLLKHAILDRASDIHIEPIEKEVIVRYRIDGILHDAMTLPKNTAPGIVARIKVLSNLKLDEHRLPQDGRFRFNIDQGKYSVRVSVLPVLGGEKIVMRLLAEGSKGYGLEELGLRRESLEEVRAAIRKPTGLILITGPTGSGKTTTLYSILEILNTPEVNISTVEDPIEYRIPRINQTQVNSKIGLTFANGLRSLLRQDPDMIMVGEIRDKETASLAINAALTGHLVLSTLHTNDAAGAIPRLIDMGVEPFLIASTLNLIIAQRLVRKLCDGKKEAELTPKMVKELSRICDLKKISKILKEQKLAKFKRKNNLPSFFEPQKTKDCSTGYKGRIGIYEVLPITESIKALINQEVFSSQIKERAVRDGMKTMVEDGFIKAAQGITSVEEVVRVTTE